MRWKTILVPHDFSSSANLAAAIACEEARVHGATLLLLHVIELPPNLQPDMLFIPSETGAPLSVKDVALTTTASQLHEIAARLAQGGVPATHYVRIGHPVDEILRFADDYNVDLVIMGTHGRSGIRHLVAGSVAERVVRASKVPVMTIRGRPER